MNQIIQTPNNLISYEVNQIYEENIVKVKKKTTKFFKFYFLFSSLIVLFFSLYYFYRLSNINKNEKLSQILIKNYDISRLYSDSQNISSINLNNGDTFSVIGILQIDKIDLKYPILSDTSDYLLKIAPCRFYGPLPNEIRKLMYCFP